MKPIVSKISIKLASLALPFSMSVIGSDAASQEKPNILIIMGDDATYNDLPFELDQWMERQGDPGIALDTREAVKNARNDNHFER